ncbi:MAG TPA: helix-turn-helix domain-containing protein [Thermoleophilaceae bacterium]
MPQQIGDTLREARMRQKIDITEIEAKTKIRAKYLRAMENEEFDLLPGSTFAKSFLRTYAEALGLDAHRLLDEYRAQYEPREEGELPPLAGQPRARDRRDRRDRRYERRPPGRGAAIVAVILVGVIVLAVIGLVSSGGGSKATSSTSTQATKPKKPHRRHHSTHAATPTRVSLRITPTVPTYICVDRGLGTTPVYQGITSQTQAFHGHHLRVNLGKTSVTITANGKRVPLVVGPNPAGIDFTPGKHKDIPVGQRPCA